MYYLYMFNNEILYTLLYLFIICVVTDTFAMLTGMFIGKHKLCPKIKFDKLKKKCILMLIF